MEGASLSSISLPLLLRYTECNTIDAGGKPRNPLHRRDTTSYLAEVVKTAWHHPDGLL